MARYQITVTVADTVGRAFEDHVDLEAARRSAIASALFALGEDLPESGDAVAECEIVNFYRSDDYLAFRVTGAIRPSDARI